MDLKTNRSVTVIYYITDRLRELLGMRIFNFVNLENLLHMKRYRKLILNKVQKHLKKIKALQTTKLVLIPRGILSFKQYCPRYPPSQMA